MGFSKICQNCADRVLGCHSTCEKYITEKERWRSMKETTRKDKEVDLYSNGRILKNANKRAIANKIHIRVKRNGAR